MESTKTPATQRYLIAVDGSEQSAKAVKWTLHEIAKMKEPALVDVIFVHIIPKCDEKNSEEYQKLKGDIQKELQQYQTYFIEVGAQSSAIILIEDPQPTGASICKQVEDKLIDVLVIGNTGKGILERWTVGSVSEHCVKNAKCVVVVVK